MAKKKQHFETALRQLEEIVAHMESGELPLDECVEYYKQAVKLKEICAKELEAAQQRIEQVRLNEKGEVVTEPLKVADEERAGEGSDEHHGA